MPIIYVYKYENEYLRKNKSIISISDFLKFIEQKTENKDLSDFLKIIYLKSLVENPSYLWPRHIKLFDAMVLSETLKLEKKNNNYFSLIEQTVSSFYASQKGEKAYLFQAEDKSGNQFNLKNYIGKVVFIDVWATWCGPCVKQRPKVLEFAKKYEGSNNIEILLISIDSSKEKWLNFLDEENQNFGKDLFIRNGFQSEFGKKYNIKTIPKYILIGKDGKIINSNIEKPTKAIEDEIKNALEAK